MKFIRRALVAAAIVVAPLSLAVTPAHAAATVEHCFAGSSNGEPVPVGPYVSNFGVVALAQCVYNGTDTTLDGTCLQWSPDGSTWYWAGEPNSPSTPACDTNDLPQLQIAVGIKQFGTAAYRVVFGWSSHGVPQFNYYGPATWF